jgi:hypothetical protein
MNSGIDDLLYPMKYDEETLLIFSKKRGFRKIVRVLYILWKENKHIFPKDAVDVAIEFQKFIRPSSFLKKTSKNFENDLITSYITYKNFQKSKDYHSLQETIVKFLKQIDYIKSNQDVTILDEKNIKEIYGNKDMFDKIQNFGYTSKIFR